jgi:hypothetical protein
MSLAECATRRTVRKEGMPSAIPAMILTAVAELDAGSDLETRLEDD